MNPKGWHNRGYLPHFDGGGILQFVTFRLADSLPQDVLDGWKIQVERNLIDDLKVQRKIERYLDAGIGECHLRDERFALPIIETLHKFDGDKFKLSAWVVMPNHVHLLLRPKENHSLASIMHSIKSFTAHKANKLLGRTGRFWNKEYFDRYIRDHEHYLKTLDYIENNPVKAKLCEKRADWRFSSAHK